MRMSRIVGLGMAAGLLAMTGCDNKLKEQNAALTQESETLRAQLVDRNLALEACQSELRQQAMRMTETERGGGARPTRMDDPFAGIAGVTSEVSQGEARATLESDVLFDSGRATLKAAAKKSLDQIASVLNSRLSGYMVRVVGHTDTDPIKKSGHKSNYHLGFERAFSVREYLISKGLPANRVSLASFGPDQPRGDKKQSRRVEIVAFQ